MMKYKLLILSIVSVLCSLSAKGQQDLVNSFFEKYSESEHVTSIYISPRFFNMFKQVDLDLEEKEAEAISNLVEDLSSLRILIAEENAKQMYQEFASDFQRANYELLMRVNNKGEDEVDFLIKESEGVVKELIMLIGGDSTDFVLLSFTGNIDLDKVSELSESFNN